MAGLAGSTAPRVAVSRILHCKTPLGRSIMYRCSSSEAPTRSDEYYMGLALQQAATAYETEEVPIGAVLVSGSEIVSLAHNQTEQRRNPLCHAELLCIMSAAEKLQAWRLQDATLYSTLEPCPMCAGAILQARLKRVVYGAKQPRIGADGSWVALLPQQQEQGVLQQQMHQKERQWQQQQHTSDGTDGQECSDLPAGPRIQSWQPSQQQQVIAAVDASPIVVQAEHQQGQQLQQQQQQQQPDHQLPQQPQQQRQQQQQSGPACIMPNSSHPFHPNIIVTSGVREAECRSIMQLFFRKRRQQQKEAKLAGLQAVHDLAVEEDATVAS